MRKILLVGLLFIFGLSNLYAVDFEKNKRGCDKGSSKACFLLGNMYDYPPYNSRMKKDSKNQQSYLKRPATEDT